MNEEEIIALLKMCDVPKDVFDKYLFVAKEVERRTRSKYFSIIQAANNAASNLELTYGEIQRYVFLKANPE